MATYIFDLESNGLLDAATVIHSLVLKDIETGEVTSACDHEQDKTVLTCSILGAVRLLQEADLIVGHNVVRFDVPLIKKLYPWFTIDETKVIDTLVCTRLIWPDMAERDAAKKRALGKLTGSHSLEAWGMRLGLHKGDYAKECKAKGIDPWASWNPEMQAYCELDVEVTYALWKRIKDTEYPQMSLDLEHKVAWIIAQQERNGFLFDSEKAAKLYGVLVGKRTELETKLQDTFRPWWSPVEIKTPTKTINYKDPIKASRTVDASYTVVNYNLFNPGSRHHIADRLSKMRGWTPTEFTDKGQPKVDEVVLGKLPYPEAKLLTEYLTVEKRIGQIAEGDQAWLKQVKADGRIHGSVNTNGAVTGRATHSHPNIAQVPAVGATYGAECRELFCVPSSKSLVGCDVSGLELRMLGHYMARFDGGAYGKEVINGDIHTANQHAAGLANRNDAKRFIYAFLYGAGPEKLALVTGRKTRAQGKRIKDQFLAKTPALKALIEGVQAAATKRGYLVGMDGRRLHVRSAHAALNTLLQSAGAIVCKQWLVHLDECIRAAGLTEHVKLVAWVHDEVQMEVTTEYAETVGKLAVKAIEMAGISLNIRVPLDGEYKIGNNWKECH